MKPIIIVGYSGHAYVAIDILRKLDRNIAGYCDTAEKKSNPFGLVYLGKENELSASMYKDCLFFIGVGDNNIRSRIYGTMERKGAVLANAIHPSAVIASSTTLGTGVMVAAGACINPLACIGNGVICNTGSSIDHESTIGDFSHVAPGAVLCGNVQVGRSCFIGARSVIKEGVHIGDNVVIGAGAVVIKNIENNARVVGCPARQI